MNSVSQKNCFITHHIPAHHSCQECIPGARQRMVVQSIQEKTFPLTVFSHVYFVMLGVTDTGMRGGLLDCSKLGAIGTAVPPPEKAVCDQHQHQTICQAGTGPLKRSKSICLPPFTAKDFSKLSHVWPLTETVIFGHLLEDLGIALFSAPRDTVIFKGVSYLGLLKISGHCVM